MRILSALVLTAAVTAACSGGGGGGGPGNSVTGTINGVPIDVKSGGIIPSQTIGNSTLAVLILSDKPDLCGQAKLGNFTPSSNWFEIELAVASTTGGSYSAATAPGDYVIGAATGDYALGAFFQYNATCQAPPPTIASSGSAHVTDFTSSGTKGSGNFMFGADAVTAHFDVEPCPELLTLSICQ